MNLPIDPLAILITGVIAGAVLALLFLFLLSTFASRRKNYNRCGICDRAMIEPNAHGWTIVATSAGAEWRCPNHPGPA